MTRTNAESGDSIDVRGLLALIDSRRSEIRQRLAERISNAHDRSVLSDALFKATLTDIHIHQVQTALYHLGFDREAVSLGLQMPAYQIHKSYASNSLPPAPLAISARSQVEARWSLFGQSIGFPIGVPASALTRDPDWVEFFAAAGFNVITYKTVRSRKHAEHPAPNWLVLKPETTPFVPEVHHEKLRSVVAERLPPIPLSGSHLSTANSFGVPSPSPEVWQEEFSTALKRISSSQMLIASVMGDHYGTHSRNELVKDFAKTARLAQEAGATVIELNVSCPNTLGKEGVQPPICYDSTLVRDIVHETRAIIRGDTNLVLKLSYLPRNVLGEMVADIGSLADGYSAINTVQCRVLDSDGRAAFTSPTGQVRELAGVAGRAIESLATATVAELARLKIETGNEYEVIGMGGVVDSESFENLYRTGATAVQAASGTFANPSLAVECAADLSTTLTINESVSPESRRAIAEKVQAKLLERTSRTSSIYEIAGSIAAPPQVTHDVIDDLADEGALEINKKGAVRTAKLVLS